MICPHCVGVALLASIPGVSLLVLWWKLRKMKRKNDTTNA